MITLRTQINCYLTPSWLSKISESRLIRAAFCFAHQSLSQESLVRTICTNYTEQESNAPIEYLSQIFVSSFSLNDPNINLSEYKMSLPDRFKAR